MLINHLENIKFQSLLSQFKNASLVNQKGELIYSKDADPFKTTTSRLVLYQLAKKYLMPKSGDVVIVNDPLNGGTSLQRLCFVGGLTDQLFIIWDEEHLPLSLKIPLTPLIENHKKNEMIWQALCAAIPDSKWFQKFIEFNLVRFQKLFNLKNYLNKISSESFQKKWFGITEAIFDAHFDLKSLGNYSLNCTYKDLNYRLGVSAIEKQDVRQIQINFSTVNPALALSDFSAASHVVESGLVIELIKFYNLEKYVSQPVLDHIKLILPPNSGISKAHQTGCYNFEIQKMTRQFIRHSLNQINTQTKKVDASFNLYSTYLLQFRQGSHSESAYLSNSRIEFSDLKFLTPQSLLMADGHYKADLKNTSNNPVNVKVMGIASQNDRTNRWLKINEKNISDVDVVLNPGDSLKFNWKI